MCQRAIVQCGDKTTEWTDIAAISYWLKVWNPDLDEKSRRWREIRRIEDLDGKTGRRGSHRSGVNSREDLEYFRQTLAVKGEIESETMLVHARKCEF